MVNLAQTVALPSNEVIDVSLAESPARVVITNPITPEEYAYESTNSCTIVFKSDVFTSPVPAFVFDQSTLAVVRERDEILDAPVVNAAGVDTSNPKMVTSGSSSVPEVLRTVRIAELIVEPAGMVIPRNRHPFHTPDVSQFAKGLAVILTTVATSLASSPEAATAIGPITVICHHTQIRFQRP
jgi:hypothetical protein